MFVHLVLRKRERPVDDGRRLIEFFIISNGGTLILLFL